ncbi:copper-binding protein [Variovorax sp. RTB1]|uniref:copper-binding protein n=1 Tax=Variovorax sp. RTB1 TaxID=3048631 RepID=UPI002B23E172|nr:copper-binding protein [Variovorax sp. RTB1]MEB0112457.1 copper-binding protein [Variovorax sp. RTB1]
MKTYLLLAIALLVTSSAANAQKPMESVSMPAGSTKLATKPVGLLTDAVIQRIDTANGGIVLKHGDIPNLGMPAMTMAFEADAATLKRVKAEEKVRFQR